MKNTAVLLQTERKAVSVDTPAQIPNTEEPCISSKRTIQGFLTYRQGTAKNGNWSTTDGHLWNAQTSGKR